MDYFVIIDSTKDYNLFLVSPIVSPYTNQKAPKTFIINVIGAFFAVGGGIEPP